jgi:ribosome-binding protein aMBF1 (putative translation factor)
MEAESEIVEPVVEIVRDEREPEESQARHFRAALLEDPEIVNEVKHYLALQQIDYTNRISEIEAFLGFAQSCEGLGARLSKVEAFLGIKA